MTAAVVDSWFGGRSVTYKRVKSTNEPTRLDVVCGLLRKSSALEKCCSIREIKLYDAFIFRYSDSSDFITP